MRTENRVNKNIITEDCHDGFAPNAWVSVFDATASHEQIFLAIMQ
jgi:hypothetical protein